ncbi:MAG: hypothetical protein J6S38_06045 [Erysipelotrichaceae bacterium]|nr:hypothetical protein [Erysipelotrichaceae bacterium]
MEKIAGLKGVISVEAVENNQSEWLPEKYAVMVEQQIDWNDPEAGTFAQLVEVGIHPGAEVNVLETYGYPFLDGDLAGDNQPEVCVILEANHIKVEHRFSGISFPEGMTNYSKDGWEYLTTENESGDYHHVYEMFSQIFNGQWVAYGRSRGGRACVDYARHYPGDMKGYIPYVGVNCNGEHDPRVMEYVNTVIGDNAFGKEEAARRRKLMDDFMVECIRNRDQLQNILWEAMAAMGRSFPDWITRERLLDLTLLEFQVEFWQDDGDFKDIEDVLSLPDTTVEQRSAKNDAIYALFPRYGGDPSFYSHDYFGFSYYVGALVEEGNYEIDFSHLREVLKQAGLDDQLAIKPEDQKDLLRNFVLDDDQKDHFVFIPGHYEALDDFAKTTDQKIVFIGGDLDPWSAVYVDGGDNPNFKSYILIGKAHHTQIADFDQDTQKEIIETIRSWVQ